MGRNFKMIMNKSRKLNEMETSYIMFTVILRSSSRTTRGTVVNSLDLTKRASCVQAPYGPWAPDMEYTGYTYHQ